MIAGKLLIVTALVETATGLILLVSPTLVVALLLGVARRAGSARCGPSGRRCAALVGRRLLAGA